MLWQAFIALLSHWRARPLQLAMLVLGLSLATALWSAVQAINGEALLLGRRQEHILVLTLRDGRAHRHRFADRPAALAHRKGVRRALGQDPEA